MLTKVSIYTPRLNIPQLLLAGDIAYFDPVQIRGVTGLNPVKATVNSTQYGSIDGEIPQGNFLGKRNIVLTLGLNPNWADQSMSSLRDLVYMYFMSKQSVTLRFFSDNKPPCNIAGIVESCEPNIFSKDPEIQVSIICHQPDFIDVSPTIIEGVVGDGSSLTDIEYAGSMPAGFVLEIQSSAAVPSYTGSILVSNQTPTPQTMTFFTTVDTTQWVRIGTVHGHKFIQSINLLTGVVTNLLKLLPSESDWITLEPGPNSFGVIGESSGLVWTLTYYNRHGGL